MARTGFSGGSRVHCFIKQFTYEREGETGPTHRNPSIHVTQESQATQTPTRTARMGPSGRWVFSKGSENQMEGFKTGAMPRNCPAALANRCAACDFDVTRP